MRGVCGVSVSVKGSARSRSVANERANANANAGEPAAESPPRRLRSVATDEGARDVRVLQALGRRRGDTARLRPTRRTPPSPPLTLHYYTHYTTN